MARKREPKAPLKAALESLDAWPHKSANIQTATRHLYKEIAD